MELIIGGAYQGKLAYAREQFPEITWTDGEGCTREEALAAEGLYHLEAFLRRQMEAGASVEKLSQELLASGRLQAVICDEVGSGIVPADPFERELRERTGRICTDLATEAKRVHRVVCGIGTVIKDA